MKNKFNVKAICIDDFKIGFCNVWAEPLVILDV